MNRTNPFLSSSLLNRMENERVSKAITQYYAGGPAKPKWPLLPPPPLAPVVLPSSTASVRPFNPLQVQQNRAASIQEQTAANQPQLKPTGYVPQPVKQAFSYAQERRELEDKALNIADKAALTLPIPYVGETVGVVGAGVGAGIRGVRAMNDVQRGNYLSAADNAVNSLTSVVLPGLVKKVSEVAKQQLVVRNLATRPTFAPAVAQTQVEADAGAQWARDWFRGRAESSMGGLTPADARLSQAIKRPVVPDVPTWNSMVPPSRFPGKTTHGMYYPAQNVAAVSPTTAYPQSFAVHEVTHQMQQAAKNTPAMKQGLATIKRELPTSPDYVRPQAGFDRYFEKPIEVHARLMQLRHELGYKPGEIITKERFMTDLRNQIDRRGKLGYAADYFDMHRVGFDNTVKWLNKLPSAVLPLATGAAGASLVAGIPPQKPRN